MRIRVLVALVREQQAGRAQVGDDPLLRGEDLEPGVRPRGRGEAAGTVDRREDRKFVTDPGLEVLGAVPRRRVDEAGPGLHLDVVGADQRRVAIEERVAGHRPDERRAARDGPPDGRTGVAGVLGGERVGQGRRDDNELAAEFEEHVLFGRVEGDRDVPRERPGRGRPDRHPQRRSGGVREPEPPQEVGAPERGRREAHVDRGRDVVVVLDLGLGQGGLVGNAPQGRAQALVELLLLRQVGQRLHDRRLEPRVDRHVGVVEVAEEAHTEHLGPLPVEPVQCPLAAFRPELQRVDLVEVEPEMDQCLPLDRQPVHVPTRDEVRPASVEQVDLHERVLEDAVEKVSHVQVAVGIRRPVVEDERGVPGVLCEALAVDVCFGPPADPVGFAFGELGPHREVRSGQVERTAVVVAGRLGIGHGRPDLRAASGRPIHAAGWPSAS